MEMVYVPYLGKYLKLQIGQIFNFDNVHCDYTVTKLEKNQIELSWGLENKCKYYYENINYSLCITFYYTVYVNNSDYEILETLDQVKQYLKNKNIYLENIKTDQIMNFAEFIILVQKHSKPITEQ